jgi:hypothetical protein
MKENSSTCPVSVVSEDWKQAKYPNNEIPAEYTEPDSVGSNLTNTPKNLIWHFCPARP